MSGFAIRSDGPGHAVVTAGDYVLELDGTGVDELETACRRLLHALATQTTAETDADLRAQVPGLAPTARLHAWMFAAFMTWMPVLVFAVDGPRTAVYARTFAEGTPMRLIARPGIDPEAPVVVATADVERTARAFVAGRDA